MKVRFKSSSVMFLAGAVTGVPAFFLRVSDLPISAQIAWCLVVLACGIAGRALWEIVRH